MGREPRSTPLHDLDRTDRFPAPELGGAPVDATGVSRTDTWVAPVVPASHAESVAASVAAAELVAALADVERLQAQLAERDAQIREPEVQLVLHERESAQRLEDAGAFQQDLGAMRGRVESQLEQLYAIEGRCGALEALSSAARATGVESDREVAQQLEASRAEARRLREELESSGARIGSLTEDLGAAEHLIDHLESQLRMLKQLAAAKAGDALAVSSTALTSTMVGVPSPQAMLPGAVPAYGGDLDELDPFVGTELPDDGRVRLLIRTDPGSGVVHVLGRRTTIGRTRDNALQIDANYISRHHAAIFAGPDRTIVQDLGSTNGVHVNGRRVAREELHDGDIVLIGKARFRFAIRNAP